jgi:hypothetical protein
MHTQGRDETAIRGKFEARRRATPVGRRLKGALAGGFAVWAMDRVTDLMWRSERPSLRARESLARPRGLDPAHVLANRLAERFGRPLAPAQPHPLALTLHYAIGMLPGLWMTRRTRRGRLPGALGAAAAGAGMFLLQDELLNRVLRSAGPLRAYPWQAHARGLVGHVVYSLALTGALRLAGAGPSPGRSGYNPAARAAS